MFVVLVVILPGYVCSVLLRGPPGFSQISFQGVVIGHCFCLCALQFFAPAQGGSQHNYCLYYILDTERLREHRRISRTSCVDVLFGLS
jgi:hypothetical protein